MDTVSGLGFSSISSFYQWIVPMLIAAVLALAGWVVALALRSRKGNTKESSYNVSEVLNKLNSFQEAFFSEFREFIKTVKYNPSINSEKVTTGGILFLANTLNKEHTWIRSWALYKNIPFDDYLVSLTSENIANKLSNLSNYLIIIVGTNVSRENLNGVLNLYSDSFLKFVQNGGCLVVFGQYEGFTLTYEDAYEFLNKLGIKLATSDKGKDQIINKKAKTFSFIDSIDDKYLSISKTQAYSANTYWSTLEIEPECKSNYEILITNTNNGILMARGQFDKGLCIITTNEPANSGHRELVINILDDILLASNKLKKI